MSPPRIPLSFRCRAPSQRHTFCPTPTSVIADTCAPVRSHCAARTQPERRTHVSQVDANPNPVYQDEPPRMNPTDAAATRALGRSSTYGIWVILALAILVL